MLNSPVLLLNRSYLPIHVTSVRRAFSLVYQGIARIMDGEYRTFDFEQWSRLCVDQGRVGRANGSHDGDEWIGTSRGPLRAPRVIVLTVFDRMPRRHVRFSRANVLTRDGFTCQYCGDCPSHSHTNPTYHDTTTPQ